MKAKRILSMLLCASVLAVSFAVPAMADSASNVRNSSNVRYSSNVRNPSNVRNSSNVSNSHDFTIESGVLTQYRGNGGKITIPAGVTSIADEVFEDDTGITNVDFSKCAITSIGNMAFFDTGLTSVTIPETVESIGDAAFSGCKNLKSITVAADNAHYISDKGILFDKGKTILIQYPAASGRSSYTVPASVRNISTGAFEECAKIKTVNFSKCALTSIGDLAFSGAGLCSVTVPGTVANIGASAFANCSNLTDINVSAANKNFLSDNHGALFDRSKTDLIQYPAGNTQYNSYTIPDTVESIGANAFYNCKALNSVTFPTDTASRLTTISYSAFYGCTSLTGVNIPESVTTIGGFAFSGTDLKTVTIPASVTIVGDEAFVGCTDLSSITVDSGNTNYKSDNGVLFNSDKSSLIQYPVGNKIKAYTVPASVTGIGDCAFYGASNLASVNFSTDSSSKLTSIGYGAFYYCTGLTAVTIPKSVISIGNYAFNSCTSLASINIPNGVANIGYRSFAATGLTSVTIPASVEMIGSGAFGLCTNLTDFTVDSDNNKYKSKNGVLFNKNGTLLIQFPVKSEITSYTIPAGVTVISNGAFSGCEDLNNVIIQSGVKGVGSAAFYHCSDLASITIPDSVKFIGNDALAGCLGVTVYCHKNSYAQIYAADNGIKTADISVKTKVGKN